MQPACRLVALVRFMVRVTVRVRIRSGSRRLLQISVYRKSRIGCHFSCDNLIERVLKVVAYTSGNIVEIRLFMITVTVDGLR